MASALSLEELKKVNEKIEMGLEKLKMNRTQLFSEVKEVECQTEKLSSPSILASYQEVGCQTDSSYQEVGCQTTKDDKSSLLSAVKAHTLHPHSFYSPRRSKRIQNLIISNSK